MVDNLSLAKQPDFPLIIDEFTLEKSLRFLPNQRLVTKATYHKQPILLKQTVANSKGQRLLNKELVGHGIAKDAGLAVPALIFSTRQVGGLATIAYEWLANSRALQESDLSEAEICKTLMSIIATLHQYGAIHDDLHVENLLRVADDIFLVDFSAVKQISQTPLSIEQSLSNLAVLVVQFTYLGQQRFQAFFSAYCELRGISLDDSLMARLESEIRKTEQKRHKSYIKKCFRPCSMTVYHQSLNMRYAFRRSFFNALDDDFIETIDKIIESAIRLKDGNSATVVKTMVGQQNIVIKRYNIKSVFHFIKRSFRFSRASNAWQYGNLLEVIGLPTPKVLGFIEKRFGPIRRESYLITEWFPAQELSEFCAENEPQGEIAEQVSNILALMQHYQLHHGDLKASNFLVGVNHHVQLIDLDAMKKISNEENFLVAHDKDRKRFERNWQPSTTVKESDR